MLKAIISITVALAFSTGVQASNWVEIGDAGTSKLSLNMKTLQISGSKRKIWARWDENQVKPKGVAYTPNHLTFDCEARKYVLEDWIDYRSDGTVIESKAKFIINEADDVPPDSAVDQMFSIVCSGHSE